MRLAVVIPAYNEARRIGAVVSSLRSVTDNVIVVDDGSADGTFDVAKAAGATVLRHLVNRGQGAALKTGTVAALRQGADVIVHFDADGQHDVAGITALVAPLVDGSADVVYGSRFLGVEAVGMPMSRRLLLKAARAFSVLILGTPSGFTDPQSGLRAITADAARRLDFRQDHFAHASEMLMLIGQGGLRWKEVPTRVTYTAETLEKGQRGVSAPLAAWKIIWHLILSVID